MINIRGGCIPDYATTASQTEMSVPVFMPYIFTEVAGTRLTHGITSQMFRLCAMNRNAPNKNFEDESLAADEKKYKKGYKVPVKFNRATTLKETLALFNDILIAKQADDYHHRQNMTDLYCLDEFTCLQFVKEHQTIILASEHLVGHLKIMHQNSKNLHIQLISKLYGLNGFYRVKMDLVEYFLQVRSEHEKSETIELQNPDSICGHKTIFEHYKWCRHVFGVNKASKKGKDSLQEIGNRAFSLLWKFNTPEYAAQFNVDYIPAFIKLQALKQHHYLK